MNLLASQTKLRPLDDAMRRLDVYRAHGIPIPDNFIESVNAAPAKQPAEQPSPGAQKPKRAPITTLDVRDLLQQSGIQVRQNLLSGQIEVTGMPERYSGANALNTLPTIAKLAKQDKRIDTKTPKNVKHYLLPLSRSDFQ